MPLFIWGSQEDNRRAGNAAPEAREGHRSTLSSQEDYEGILDLVWRLERWYRYEDELDRRIDNDK